MGVLGETIIPFWRLELSELGISLTVTRTYGWRHLSTRTCFLRPTSTLQPLPFFGGSVETTPSLKIKITKG